MEAMRRWAGIAWHFVVLVAILGLPASLALGESPWNLSKADTLLVVAMAGAYLAGALAAHWIGVPRLLAGASVALGALAFIYLGLLLQPSLSYSRILLLGTSLLVLAGVLAAPLFLRLPAKLSWPLAAALLAAVAGRTVLGLQSDSLARSPQRQIVQAGQQILSVEHFAGYLPKHPGATGGAITRAPDGMGYLLVTARGDFYRLNWGVADELQVADLRLRAPINREQFGSDASNDGWKARFRIADVAVQRHQGATTIFVSHHFWKRDQKCFVVRVSSHAWPPHPEEPQDPPGRWRTVYETKPCLPIEQHRGADFAGEQIGGNLEFLNSRELLFTVGDHQFDGWYKPTNHVQDVNADYGKTLLVDTATGTSSIFTLGHRNSQGLTVDADGRIWGTDHGPMGGDELNLLRRGGNYGYPTHTYGTDYGSVIWPPGEKAGISGEEHVSPLYAWVPSIGISEVVSVADPAFGRWRGDLLVASLRSQTLWRVRVQGDRVVYAEPIPLGERLRDVAAGEGEFVLWTDSQTLIRVRPVAHLDDGAILFTLRCGGCHRSSEHRIGPSLEGVVGRSIAAASGYGYSEAMKSLPGRWTEERLEDFLADPRAYAPGTTMVMDGVPDAESRRKIVQYLKEFR